MLKTMNKVSLSDLCVALHASSSLTSRVIGSCVLVRAVLLIQAVGSDADNHHQRDINHEQAPERCHAELSSHIDDRVAAW